MNLDSKGLERSVGNIGVKKLTLFNVFDWVLDFQMKYVILECQSKPTFLFGLYLNKTLKICSIDLNHSL